jgi:hypothetical protein
LNAPLPVQNPFIVDEILYILAFGILVTRLLVRIPDRLGQTDKSTAKNQQDNNNFSTMVNNLSASK